MKYEDIKTGGVYRNHKIKSKNGGTHNCVVLMKAKPNVYDSLILSSKQRGAKLLPGLSSQYGKDIYLGLPSIDNPRNLSISDYKITDKRDFMVINKMKNRIK